jgi:integrase
VAAILLAQVGSYRSSSPDHQAAKILIAHAGSLSPKKLSAAHIAEINEYLEKGSFTTATRYEYASVVKRHLRTLWEYHGAPKLDQLINHHVRPKPRNVTARTAEIDALLVAAPDHLRLMILLCLDLAIRSGTAGNLAPKHYDEQDETLTFTTKCDEHLNLPVTEEIRELIEQCDMDRGVPFVRQLCQREKEKGIHGGTPIRDDGPTQTFGVQFRALKEKIGITRKLTFHDLRRTAAVGMYNETHDIREVQGLLGHKNMLSTVWYLDHELHQVSRARLELIKSKRKERIA